MTLGALICLLVFQLAGELTVRSVNLPFPGPVVGMLFMFTALVVRGGVPENLRVTSSSLLQHLMLLLIPATAGLMMHFRRLSDEWLPILVAGIGSAAVTLAVTAVTLRWLVTRRKGG